MLTSGFCVFASAKAQTLDVNSKRNYQFISDYRNPLIPNRLEPLRIIQNDQLLENRLPNLPRLFPLRLRRFVQHDVDGTWSHGISFLNHLLTKLKSDTIIK